MSDVLPMEYEIEGKNTYELTIIFPPQTTAHNLSLKIQCNATQIFIQNFPSITLKDTSQPGKLSGTVSRDRILLKSTNFLVDQNVDTTLSSCSSNPKFTLESTSMLLVDYKKKKSSAIVWIILVIVVVLLIAAGVAYYFLRMKQLKKRMIK